MTLTAIEDSMTEVLEVTSRVATEKDMRDILPLVAEFAEESDWGFTYNKENSIKILNNYLNHPGADVVLCYYGHMPIGVATVAADQEYHDELIGYVSKFYIAKAGRRLGAGRKLNEFLNEWFKEQGCVVSFSTGTAKVPEQGVAFNNLFKRSGYESCGEALVNYIK